MVNNDVDIVYDVLIVGAGIAGASAAYFLRREGLQVLVLEKEVLPRFKACGGGVPRSAFDLFPFSLDPVVECEITAVRYSFRGERELSVPLPSRPLVMVMRDRLDSYVLEKAQVEVAEGEKVRTVRQDESSVTVRTDSGREWRGRYLIGADGANSVVARAVGLRRKKKPVGIALEAELPTDGTRLGQYAGEALFLFGAVPQGYLWIFPKRHQLSVGIGAFRRSQQKLKAILLKEMSRRGLSLDGVPLHGHPLPIYWGKEPLHRDRVLLAGDAAGLMDPLLGEGIRYAMRSARIAADALLNGDLAGYTRQVHQQIGRHLSMARLFALPLYCWPRAAFEMGLRSPYVTPDFVRMAAGTLSYGAMLLRLPRYVLGGLIRRLPLERKERG
jgi:geranylgeranyl reductase family protein